MTILKITDIDLHNQRVLIREDFNVPMQEKHITSDARIRAALPTIQHVLNAGGKLILMSHLGRPIEGQFSQEFSLTPVAECLSELLNKEVKLITDWQHGVDLAQGEVVLLENVRFLPGEKANDEKLSKALASLCDVFVMDAFATAHRAEASTVGVAQFAPIACAGLLLMAELDALEKALQNPARPLVAIIGGSKISTKLLLLQNLITKVDKLIVGGGIANVFLAAKGIAVGKSLLEKDLIVKANEMLKLAEQNQVEILLPTDVVVAQEFSATAKRTIKPVTNIMENEMILDVGMVTAEQYAQAIHKAGTVLWNGPVGVFEFDAFAEGTKTLARAIANAKVFSIAGGGDTLAAIEKYAIADKISYISTGGGAFLEFVEGKELPAVKILRECAIKT